MKNILLILLLFLPGCASSVAENRKTSGFVLTNVNIVDVEQRRIVPNQSILVQGRVITQITTDQEPYPEPVEVIDGAGGFITPGLIDMHVHMYESAAYSLALSHGVTHVRVMHGIPRQLEWRDAVKNGQLAGASSTVSSPIISAYDDAWLHHPVHSEDEARLAVRKYHELGYDLIKVYGGLSEAALLALVDEARILDMPVAKHGPHAVGNLPLATLTGLQSFEHVEDIYQGSLNYEFAAKRLPDVIEQLKTTAVPITPTLNIFHHLTRLSEDKQAYLDSIPQDYTSDIIAIEARQNQVKRWLNASDGLAKHNRRTFNFLNHITRKLYQSELPLLVGSDSGVLLTPHGLATHSEMQLLNEAGLASFDVLAAATINPARALGLGRQIGKIAVGFNADFVFTRQSPLEDLKTLEYPDAVSKSGIWYSRDELVRLRQDAIANRSIWSELQALWQAM